MTHISLIIATMGRVEELRDLFDSLVAQSHPALDVILIDQNRDERLAPVVAAYAPQLTLRHMRSPRPHANAARNLGLRAAIGDIVAFPDDDCTLPPGTLARVARSFGDPGLEVLTGPAASPTGGLGSGRWHRASRYLQGAGPAGPARPILCASRQSSSESLSYPKLAAKIIQEEGLAGLFGRGLQVQSVCLSVS
jgi:glycosyltransferase involved in cell wall biosynthesis